MRLKDKVCVVTAAGQGIGAATARAFAREGATVWATDVDAAKLQGLAGQTGVQARKLDVLDKAAIAALAREAGAVDVLFNCAGVVHHGTVLDATDEQWQFAFDLNVRSMLWTIQAFLPGMLAKGGGSIVNMSTPSLDERISSLGGGADARQFFLQRQPTGRFGSADEIANLAVYLASDEAAFTTGTVNVIDGGWSV